MTIRIRLVFLVALFLLASTASAARRERLIDTWKPVDYNISITLDDGLTQITSARAEITIVTLKENVTAIDFDFGALTVDGVSVLHEGATQTATFDRAGETLRVKLPRALHRNSRAVIAITYHGVPADGLILSVDKAGKRSAIGDNWPNRVHHWIPSFDHPSAKAAVKFAVTAPKRTAVVANGKFQQVTNSPNGSATWTYAEAVPIPAYCMVIAVGEFSVMSPLENVVTPLTYYVPQPDSEAAPKGFSAAGPSLKFFTETVAPYPYEKLALIVGATRFGGMENSSAIVFSNNLFASRSNSQVMSQTFGVREGLVTLIAHEIAHQWFGDSVTESTWADLWLSEGFATYFASVFLQRTDGEQSFRRQMAQHATAYIEYAKNTRLPLHDTETENLMNLLNPNNYQKGAWVLHMLRSELGDENFFKGIRAYYGANANKTASSEDLRAALEKVSHRSLHNVFAKWVYSVGHPQYKLSWQWNARTKRVRLSLQQTQVEPAFLNTVPVEVVSSCGARRVVFHPVGKQHVAEVVLEAAPTAVNLDPDQTILKEATVAPAPVSPVKFSPVHRNIPCVSISK